MSDLLDSFKQDVLANELSAEAKRIEDEQLNEFEMISFCAESTMNEVKQFLGFAAALQNNFDQYIAGKDEISQEAYQDYQKATEIVFMAVGAADHAHLIAPSFEAADTAGEKKDGVIKGTLKTAASKFVQFIKWLGKMLMKPFEFLMGRKKEKDEFKDKVKQMNIDPETMVEVTLPSPFIKDGKLDSTFIFNDLIPALKKTLAMTVTNTEKQIKVFELPAKDIPKTLIEVSEKIEKEVKDNEENFKIVQSYTNNKTTEKITLKATDCVEFILKLDSATGDFTKDIRSLSDKNNMLSKRFDMKDSLSWMEEGDEYQKIAVSIQRDYYNTVRETLAVLMPQILKIDSIVISGLKLVANETGKTKKAEEKEETKEK